MSDRYDFANLSPVEFESLCADLVSADTGLRFERFSEGADGGLDGRHSRTNGDIILQAKHYKNSTWADLQRSIKREKININNLNPSDYYLLTSQPLTPQRKQTLVSLLNHPSVSTSNIWGRTELNAHLAKHTDVERRNIKLWISSSAVLDRLLKNDIAVFTEATHDEIKRILRVFVSNPSLNKSAKILQKIHSLIISGPPGVGKTTLAQFLAAEYSDQGWELVSITSIDDGLRSFYRNKRQVFIFDDFLGKIRLDPNSLARDEGKIVRFMSMVYKDNSKRFILTSRSYVLQAARDISETLDDERIEMSEMVLNIETYTREIKARILYNHLYHSEIDHEFIKALLANDTARQIIDHPNYIPRIIQWMTEEMRHIDVTPLDYPKLFINTLENPDKIWNKAFRNHISSKARILLYCIYFVGQERFSNRGAKLNKLKQFFEKAIIEFGIISAEDLREIMFEATLSEVKSSFIVIEEGRVNFINPSVQDFLSRETADTTVLATLSRCVPTISTAVSLWKKIGTVPSDTIKARIADSLMASFVSNRIEGRLPLHETARLFGDLIIATGKSSYCDRLRRPGVNRYFWINEVDIPALFDALDSGKYSHLPHARAYARYLRLELFKYISPEIENDIELEELSKLASNLSAAKLEMSDIFYEKFENVVETTVELLDVDEIDSSDDPEDTIGEWLEHIKNIEEITNISIDYFKIRELEERISEIQQEEELKRQEEEQQDPTPRGNNAGKYSFRKEPFSDADIKSMFSSLKKL